MANYTIQQAKVINGLSADIILWLDKLQTSKLPNAKEKKFTCANRDALKQTVESAYNNYKKSKENRDAYNECINVIKSLTKGTKGNRRIISAKDLLPRLQALKNDIENEKQTKEIDKFVSNSGWTKEQIIEYLNKK